MAHPNEMFFSQEDMALYGKLNAAIHDLGSASECGGFILKKGWKAKPWSRGTVYLQQSAFVTAMITSYGRAFTKSKGWPLLPPEFLMALTPEERELHDRTMAKRHQVYAHSDSVSYDVTPWNSELVSDIEGIPLFEIAHEDVETLQSICRKMIGLIRSRKQRIKQRYLPSHDNWGA